MPSEYNVYSPVGGQLVSVNCYCYRYYQTCANCSVPGPCTCGAAAPPTPPLYCKDAPGANCANCSSCVCSRCCTHVIVSGSPYTYPLDVNGTGYVNIALSSNIRSIRIRINSGIMCATETGEIDRGIYVDTYTGTGLTGKKLGTVLYGHVASPWYTQDTTVNYTSGAPWIITLGQVPAVPPGGSLCYQSMHSHLEIKAESGVTANRVFSTCGTNMTRNVSRLYWWSY